MESEEAVHEHLAELFERIEPTCVLDVGANAGQYGEMLRQHGYRGWIVSFEPVGSAFAELAQRAGVDPAWRVFQVALGAEAARRPISVTSISQLSSFRPLNRYASEELPQASEVVAREEVDVQTLNDSWPTFLDDLPHSRLFLKLDTQGWDLEVLTGASQLVDRLAGLQLESALRPIYEGAPGFSETLDHVSELGFDLTGVFPVNRDSLGRLIEVDCVFINPHHADAGRWREPTWALLTAQLQDEVRSAVPAGAPFLLIDDDELGIDQLDGRRAIPFLERDGEYYGAPDDGRQAVCELRRQATAGIGHLAIAWPSFWWLEEYPELTAELERGWERTAQTEAALVFRLMAT